MSICLGSFAERLLALSPNVPCESELYKHAFRNQFQFANGYHQNNILKSLDECSI